MITDPVREFLQKPLIARMSTIDPEGYPHTVPVWFMLDGEDIVVISVSSTRKVGHIRANPKGAVTIGGDPGDGAGYLIKGEFSIEADPDDVWVKKLTYRYETPEQAEKDIADWVDLDIVVLRLKPTAVLKVM
jgi:PPOX class probable F420-dependent enzyme